MILLHIFSVFKGSSHNPYSAVIEFNRQNLTSVAVVMAEVSQLGM